MKITIYLLIFFQSTISLFSYEGNNFTINLSGIYLCDDEEPLIENSLWGNRYVFIEESSLNWENLKIHYGIYSIIDYKIIPYSEKSRSLLISYFSNNKKFNVTTLIPDYLGYYIYREKYLDFIEWKKPRGLTYLPSYKPDILYGRDGTRIERDYSRGFWEETGAEDRLTYYFKGNRGLYSDYIIEFYGIWDAFWDVHDDSLLTPKLKDFDPPDGGQYIQELFTMTNAELAAYPDQDDPAIRLMHLLNESMATFRFTEDPNAPPANLALVNDDRVRIRSGYSLEGEILGHGNRGEEVIVMERSPERQTIGGQTDYWYKIVSKRSFTKGWMFGPFLDFRE